jgi:hypothetical protein
VREPIDVEPEVYDAASKVFGDKVYSQLLKAGADLEAALAGSGAMAGSDPAGVSWASAYDDAARANHAVMIDLETACLKIAAMLQQTGFNHGMADSASDPTRSTPTPADSGVYLPGKRAVPDLPSARGGSTGTPAGWWLIEHTVGYVWPNGHPDRLRTAANAWANAADTIVGASYSIPEAVQGIAAQRSPEVQDAFTVCNSMNEHIEDVAASCRDLSKACSDFADGIDKAHHDVEDELASLLKWTAAIEAGGALVGLFSLGIGEGAAQGIEATRIAATAARVGKIIETVVELAGTVSRAIGTIFSKIGKVAQRLLRIERAELSEATVTAASKTPEVVEDTEAAAVKGLETFEKQAATRDQELSSLSYPEKQLQAKFKHAKDFGIEGNWSKTAAKSYEEALEEFAKNPNNTMKAGTYRGEPATFIYNEESKMCEILRPDGTYWSGWKLTDDQLEFMIKKGSLGGD